MNKKRKEQTKSAKSKHIKGNSSRDGKRAKDKSGIRFAVRRKEETPFTVHLV